MGDISTNFSRWEFTCHGNGRPGHTSHPTSVSSELLTKLEHLRRLGGDRPLYVVSGHRCPWWNRQIGGASRSQHLFGRAVDLHEGRYTVAQAKQAGFTGIGTRLGFAVHVDVRRSPATWSY